MVVQGILGIADWKAEAEPLQRALVEWAMTTPGGAQVNEHVPAPMTAHQERALSVEFSFGRDLIQVSLFEFGTL